MSLIASFPGGLQKLGLRRIGLTALAFCLAPAVGGAVVLGLRMLAAWGGAAQGADLTEGLATFALISPLMGVPIWSLIAVTSAMLLRWERFGWLPAAVLGAAAFSILMRTEFGLLSLPFGAVLGMLYRMALALQRPEAF